jgi:cyanophycinase
MVEASPQVNDLLPFFLKKFEQFSCCTTTNFYFFVSYTVCMRRKFVSFRKAFVVSVAFFSLSCASTLQATAKYFRAGNEADSTVTPQGGYALMGGGSKLDSAYLFLCERANGGDFLTLRANTEDDYAQKVNAEMLATCPLNSAATIVFSDREDADDPKIVQIIEHAEAIFFAGGDQSNYVRFWQDTPVQDALNRYIAAGKPIGGSSAGLAILGESSFSSMIDTIYSPEALANPYGNKVTLTRDFLRIPLLAGTITDTQFVKRDRLGRLLVFMARVLQDEWAGRVRAIAVDENAAVLVEPGGSAKIVGGSAYFLESTRKPAACRNRVPLDFQNISVHRTVAGSSFDLRKWKGDTADDYSVSVTAGKVQATNSTHGIY